MTSCSDTNASTRHFAVRPGDLLPCGHDAVRNTEGGFSCKVEHASAMRSTRGGDPAPGSRDYTLAEFA